MIRVAAVHDGTLGAGLGLGPGWELVSINGRALEDFLDWEFLSADDTFTLVARTPAGNSVELDVERPEGLAMGVELEPPHVRRCGNRCDFCFVDGLPDGLRNSLYVRDDDYRLSFRHGNFATLTNLKARDVERILEYRLSPLYVSVHATDPVVRRRLLRNPRAPAIVPQLAALGAGGIRFHTQIVLQPGVNDGGVLKRSLEDLYALGDAVLSVSVVPVGLTEFSKHGLVREPTGEECRRALDVMERFAERALASRSYHWAYGSDDLYLVAQRPLPPAERYDGFDQVENGVGAVRYLQHRIAAGGRGLDNLRGTRAAVLTGTAMGPLMPQVLEPLAVATGGTFELIVLTNDLFGPRVTSAALLPGRSFMAVLRDRHDLDVAFLPAESLSDDAVFLDDLEARDLEAASPAEIRFSYHFTDVIIPGAKV